MTLNVCSFLCDPTPQQYVRKRPHPIHRFPHHDANADADNGTTAELPGEFCVWLASPEAKFLKSKFVWVNWNVDELKSRAEEIKNSRLLTCYLDGVPM